MPMPTGNRHGVLTSSKTLKKSSHLDHSETPPNLDRKQSGDRKPSVAVMDLFHKDKRNSLSLGLGRSGNTPSTTKGSPKNSPSLAPAKPAKLVIDFESPPLIFYGAPNQSSGALLSGLLLLTVTDPEVKLQSLEMSLNARVGYKKPVAKDCPDCQSKTNEIYKWTFLTEPTQYPKGTHTFPFSYLLPGHIPATSRGKLGDINYVLDAKAVTKMSDAITVSRPLIIQRALRPGPEKTSIRIFPPTNLTTRVMLPSVIHPIGEFPVQMQLSGIIDHSLKNLERRWRIRRMSWRIEEVSKVVSAACPKHAQKLGGEGKGILHEDIRTLGGHDIKTGWKTDFDTADGEISCEFNAAIKPDSQPLCDVSSPHGLDASHNFILEIIVAEEQQAGGGKKASVPTGAARVLRMQFKLVLTERSGMGISWDEEMPPMYGDVPRSPPEYTKIEDFEGELVPDEELDRMQR